MAAWYTQYTPATPKAVKGGIRAENKRGAFARSWWGKKWITTLESFPIGARLGRGKSYARSGQVADLLITTKGVSAKVQGSGSKPYTVVIRLTPYSEEQKATLASKLVAKPIYSAQLLSGEMSENIPGLCKTARLPLFPVKYKDLQTACSCPDQSNPCKHIAAVFYLMAEAFDRDPFLLFTLRGMDKEAFFKSIGRTQPLQGLEEAAVAPEPLPLDHTAFWKNSERHEHSFACSPPKIHAAMVKRLGPIPFWRSIKNLTASMEERYAKASLEAETLIGNQAEKQKE